LAESLLIGLIGTAMGLVAGTAMSIDARRLGAITVGYIPPIAIPWDMVGLGIGLVMLLSIIASLGPAIAVARSESLTLLQAGRASA
jgi:ABC-type lipoprotein release transport system permease subunit